MVKVAILCVFISGINISPMRASGQKKAKNFSRWKFLAIQCTCIYGMYLTGSPERRVLTGVCVMLLKLSRSLLKRSVPTILSITGVCITSPPTPTPPLGCRCFCLPWGDHTPCPAPSSPYPLATSVGVFGERGVGGVLAILGAVASDGCHDWGIIFSRFMSLVSLSTLAFWRNDESVTETESGKSYTCIVISKFNNVMSNEI